MTLLGFTNHRSRSWRPTLNIETVSPHCLPFARRIGGRQGDRPCQQPERIAGGGEAQRARSAGRGDQAASRG